MADSKKKFDAESSKVKGEITRREYLERGWIVPANVKQAPFYGAWDSESQTFTICWEE